MLFALSLPFAPYADASNTGLEHFDFSRNTARYLQSPSTFTFSVGLYPTIRPVSSTQ